MRSMFPRQHLSLVLRCLTEPARDGLLVGNVEVVDTGERVLIQSLDDLVQLVTRLVAAGEGQPAVDQRQGSAMRVSGTAGRGAMPWDGSTSAR